jgi:hypothetical protein
MDGVTGSTAIAKVVMTTLFDEMDDELQPIVVQALRLHLVKLIRLLGALFRLRFASPTKPVLYTKSPALW